MSKPILIKDWFDFTNAVPVEETTKQRWIEQAIKFLEDNPDIPMTSISSGDSLILVSRDEDGTFEISDLKVRKTGIYSAGKCICDIQVLNSKGCQCGGS